jgi:hypothetical protein
MIFVSEKERIGLRRRDDLMSCNSRPKAERPRRRQYQRSPKSEARWRGHWRKQHRDPPARPLAKTSGTL